MPPRIEAVYKLPHLTNNTLPHGIAWEGAPGQERIIIGCSGHIFRIDLAADTCKTFPIKDVSGIPHIVDVAVAAEGGYYLVREHNQLLRLDDRLEIVSTKLEPSTAILSIEATGDGIVCLLAHRDGISTPNKLHYALVRYSNTLEKQWRINFSEELVPDIPRGNVSPIVPLVARGTDRFYVAVAREGASIIEIGEPRESFHAHQIPGLERTYGGPVSYEGAIYQKQPMFSRQYQRRSHQLREPDPYLPAFWDACSHPSEDAVILSDWASWRMPNGDMATGFYDCRFDENRSEFQTHFSIMEGTFHWITALVSNRIAATGRLTFGGDWIVAIITLPDFAQAG